MAVSFWHFGVTILSLVCMSHCIMHKSCVLYLVKAKLGHCLLHGHSQMIWIPVSGFMTTQSPCLSEVRNWNAFPTPSTTRSTCSDWVLAPTSPDSAVPGTYSCLPAPHSIHARLGPHLWLSATIKVVVDSRSCVESSVSLWLHYSFKFKIFEGWPAKFHGIPTTFEH